jgi:hypothetical protein
MDKLVELQQWYESNCNDCWEHYYGIKINTLDNPGWSIAIDLTETNLQNYLFDSVNVDASDSDWYHCWVEKNQFTGRGDPSKLSKLIGIFIDWAKSQKTDWLIPPPELTSEEYQLKCDQEFYDFLSTSPLTSNYCQRGGCSNFSLHNSMMCREHHFEMIRGYSLPCNSGAG